MLGWAFLKRAWPGWWVNLPGQGQAEPCRLEHWRARQKVLVQLSDSAHWFPKNLVPFATSLLESLISSGPEVKQTYRQTYTPEGPGPTF